MKEGLGWVLNSRCAFCLPLASERPFLPKTKKSPSEKKKTRRPAQKNVKAKSKAKAKAKGRAAKQETEDSPPSKRAK